MIPLKINGLNLCQIFEPEIDFSGYTDEQIIEYSIKHLMFPTEAKLTSETYCRDADRTADYELENITNVNAKAKPEFTWDYLRADYVERLLTYCGFKYNYKNGNFIVPETAPTIDITYRDFIGMRTAHTYLGQNIDGTLTEIEEYDADSEQKVKVLYWRNFRVAFPER